MPVDAIPGDVEDAILEPVDRDLTRRKGGVFDPGEGLHPINALGMLGPETVRIGHRTRVHLLVLRLIDKGALRPLGGNIVNLLGHFILHHAATERDIASRFHSYSTYHRR